MWSVYIPGADKINRDFFKGEDPDPWRIEKKCHSTGFSFHSFIPTEANPHFPELFTPGQTEQYAYKAAFLYRFTDYIEWENMDRTLTFNIAVLGKSPITAQMTTLAREERVKNKIMSVKEYENLDNLGLPHIIFISSNSMIPVKSVIAKFSGQPVLIVTEISVRGEGGEKGYINFFVSDNKLRFEIRLKAVNNAGIKISSQLLQHAIITDM